jgi:DNA-binding transcriptional LysR family regulator
LDINNDPEGRDAHAGWMPMTLERRSTSISQADLDTRLLRYFLAVVQEGSIRKAATILNVAASAISRQLTGLEQRLGLPLLERLPRGVRPTEAGKAIADHARQQVDEGERLLDYLRQLHGLRVGAVRIRCGEGFVGDLMENGIRSFSASLPDIRLQILLGGTAEIMDSVAESRVDVGLAYDPGPHVGVRSIAVSRQPLQLLVAPDHPAAGSPPISLRDVAGQHLALLTGSHGIRQLLARVEADQGFHLVPRVEASSIEVVKRFAMSGRGITFLPAFAATTEIADGRLRAIPLTDPLLTQAAAHLLVRSQRRLPTTIDRMVGCLVASMRAFSDAAPDR